MSRFTNTTNSSWYYGSGSDYRSTGASSLDTMSDFATRETLLPQPEPARPAVKVHPDYGKAFQLAPYARVVPPASTESRATALAPTLEMAEPTTVSAQDLAPGTNLPWIIIGHNERGPIKMHPLYHLHKQMWRLAPSRKECGEIQERRERERAEREAQQGYAESQVKHSAQEEQVKRVMTGAEFGQGLDWDYIAKEGARRNEQEAAQKLLMQQGLANTNPSQGLGVPVARESVQRDPQRAAPENYVQQDSIGVKATMNLRLEQIVREGNERRMRQAAQEEPMQQHATTAKPGLISQPGQTGEANAERRIQQDAQQKQSQQIRLIKGVALQKQMQQAAEGMLAQDGHSIIRADLARDTEEVDEMRAQSAIEAKHVLQATQKPKEDTEVQAPRAVEEKYVQQTTQETLVHNGHTSTQPDLDVRQRQSTEEDMLAQAKRASPEEVPQQQATQSNPAEQDITNTQSTLNSQREARIVAGDNTLRDLEHLPTDDLDLIIVHASNLRRARGVSVPSNAQEPHLDLTGRTICEHCGSGSPSIWEGLWTELCECFYHYDQRKSHAFRLTWLGLTLLLWLLWFLLENTLCYFFCQYGSDPILFPFTIPTLLFRPFKSVWEPASEGFSLASGVLFNLFFGDETTTAAPPVQVLDTGSRWAKNTLDLTKARLSRHHEDMARNAYEFNDFTAATSTALRSAEITTPRRVVWTATAATTTAALTSVATNTPKRIAWSALRAADDIGRMWEDEVVFA